MPEPEKPKKREGLTLKVTKGSVLVTDAAASTIVMPATHPNGHVLFGKSNESKNWIGYFGRLTPVAGTEFTIESQHDLGHGTASNVIFQFSNAGGLPAKSLKRPRIRASRKDKPTGNNQPRAVSYSVRRNLRRDPATGKIMRTYIIKRGVHRIFVTS